MKRGRTISPPIDRRRFLSIAAAAGAVSPLLFSGQAKARLHRWEGRALGADASILIDLESESLAADLIAACRAEIERLEGVFSLYRTDSALSRLNSAGALDSPPLDLVELLEIAKDAWARTDGAFDATVQPLFLRYAEHFQRDGEAAGPARARIAEALAHVGMDRVAISPSRIAFRRPGMALTLNGVAQGYITDRLAGLLKAQGLANVLVNAGEYRAIGEHPEGRPWRIGIAEPEAPLTPVKMLTIRNRAVATSAPHGTVFDAAGRFHHLFDPHSGETPNLYRTVTVMAADAATADALSTALSVTPPGRAASVLKRFKDAQAVLRLDDGREMNLHS